MVKRAIKRAASRFLLRPAVALSTAGAVADGPIEFHDLRNELPISADRPYKHRPEEWIEGCFWHHSASKGQTIRNLASYHVEVRQWGGLAYTYAIGWDGTIFLCNDPTTLSFHTSGYNSRAISVVLVGDYHEKEMSEAMKVSVIRLAAHLKDKYNLRYVALHKDVKATACPGSHAEPWLRLVCFGKP